MKLSEVFPSTTFEQRSQFSTHVHGCVLDLVLDDCKSHPVDWIHRHKVTVEFYLFTYSTSSNSMLYQPMSEKKITLF